MIQVKPHQILARTKQLIETQNAKGYKASWVYHQMAKLVESKRRHVYAYSAMGLAESTHAVAAGNLSFDEFEDGLIELYEQDLQYQKQYQKEI